MKNQFSIIDGLDAKSNCNESCDVVLDTPFSKIS